MRFPLRTFQFAILLSALCSLPASGAPEDYFGIRVVDEATGRGVPLVQMVTTNAARYVTDSNGWVAFKEPGFMNENLWFTITSHGYEFPNESFGKRGTNLRTTPGERVEIKIRRNNIAERLYRVTGQGIYRDTILLGLEPPIEQPLLNARVVGQDSVQNLIYRGRLFWLWGDTNQPAHFLGNYRTVSALSDLPARGGLDPSVGVNLRYFVNQETGFAREMAPLEREGDFLPIWMDGLMLVRDPGGEERLLARYTRVRDMRTIEQGLLVFNDETERFDEVKQFPLESRRIASGHPFRVLVGDQEYFYFPLPYPSLRVRSDWGSVTDPAAYEAFTPLQTGETYSRELPPLDRDADGNLIWAWKRNTEALTSRQLADLINDGHIRREESPFRSRNVADGKPFVRHNGSVYWNEYRKKWVMIGLEFMGDTVVGEVWYAEANAPEGPWVDAVKIATHAKPGDNQDLYNVKEHPYFAQDGGRTLYFEGTYVNTFSGNPQETPWYNYNQLMYRLDLADPRLKLPEPPPGLSNARPSGVGY